MPTTITEVPRRKREVIDKACIRFCGDSGDGMQITGSQFTNTAALYGNDLATFPISRPKSAPLPALFPASADSRSISLQAMSIRPAMRLTFWSP